MFSSCEALTMKEEINDAFNLGSGAASVSGA
jgi:hypothetical protein